MDVRDIDIDLDDTNKEQKNMLSFNEEEEEFSPVQKNEKLFKYILYATKLEIKSNSLINMIYQVSAADIFLWLVSLCLFVFSPETFFLCWILIIHLAKGIFGFICLHHMPKTYEVVEKVCENPEFDENKITEVFSNEMRTFFMQRFTENKNLLLTYLILTIISIVIDLISLLVHIFMHPDTEQEEYSAIMILLCFGLLSKKINLF